MSTDYDPIAEQYQRAKQQPWRTYLECFTLLELIGDLRGLSALDLACGEGFYTRLIRKQGAARITGIDLSQGMIDLARRQEAQHRLGIEYVVGDARELPGTQPVDLVVAAYLLNYARTGAELQAMCCGIARALKPGGRFVTVNCNPAFDFPSTPSFRQYGFEVALRGEWKEGTPIRWKFYLDDGAFEIENYYLSPATYEQALLSAGFDNMRWHGPGVSREGQAAYDAGYWDLLLRNAPVTFLECTKERAVGSCAP